LLGLLFFKVTKYKASFYRKINTTLVIVFVLEKQNLCGTPKTNKKKSKLDSLEI
jgi:hypothetical protein